MYDFRVCGLLFFFIVIDQLNLGVGLLIVFYDFVGMVCRVIIDDDQVLWDQGLCCNGFNGVFNEVFFVVGWYDDDIFYIVQFFWKNNLLIVFIWLVVRFMFFMWKLQGWNL